LSIGQDSWQAEQRNPYFRANAGKASARWLTPNIRNRTDRATSKKDAEKEDL
jgi:hypothetical protein